MTPDLLFLALGSNLGDRESILVRAAAALVRELGALQASSSVYETLPLTLEGVRPQAQPLYCNLVLSLACCLDARAVLDCTQKIELSLGRSRRAEHLRWQPRVIDIDILAYGACRLEDANLFIPHPRMKDRDFVLKPLAEIAPHWVHPESGLTAAQMLASLPGDGLTMLRRVMSSAEFLGHVEKVRHEVQTISGTPSHDSSKFI